jgi:septal ring factor EnvC (AmiA/AmiB activator)
MRLLTARAPGILACAVIVALQGARYPTSAVDARKQRLEALQHEMKQLQGEMAGLALRERGVLGDVARLDAEIALRRAELEDVSLRLRDTEERLAGSEQALTTIAAEQKRRAPLLAARLCEIYKRGPSGLPAGVFGRLNVPAGLDGFRYASYLSRRDASQLAGWRSASRRLGEERQTLSVERARLASLRSEASRKEAALTSGRASRASLLTRIRGDRAQHEKAYGELEVAARSLGRLVESFEETPAHVALDVRAFRGLLDWPAAGAVSTGFGTVVHPRFKTEIPHPGLDIDAPQGEPFRSIFDGRVAYAASLTGYGLTVVVDHGHGVVSIYAHAEALLVAQGDDVERGQDLGRTGDSASLRGPYLYFELRDGGRPVDPSSWLRPR